MTIDPAFGGQKGMGMRSKVQIVFAMALAVIIGGVISTSIGQEAGKAAAPAAPAAMKAPAAPVPASGSPAAAAPTEEVGMTLWQYWVVGGWCMWPIGLLSVTMIALIVYGFMLVGERKMLTPQLVGPLTEAVKQLRIDDAMSMCASTPALLTNILHSGLQRISKGTLDVGSMEKAMEESSSVETAQGLRMISYLSVVASTAPMWGLLGTVSGMVKAFEKIGKGMMGKPELLANDIGEALITTYAGLVVGIPAMCFYFYLKTRYTENLTQLGRILGNLTNELVTSSREAADGGLGTPDERPESSPSQA
jgi:biopolymer transport protein ExbB